MAIALGDGGVHERLRFLDGSFSSFSNFLAFFSFLSFFFSFFLPSSEFSSPTLFSLPMLLRVLCARTRSPDSTGVGWASSSSLGEDIGLSFGDVSGNSASLPEAPLISPLSVRRAAAFKATLCRLALSFLVATKVAFVSCISSSAAASASSSSTTLFPASVLFAHFLAASFAAKRLALASCTSRIIGASRLSWDRSRRIAAACCKRCRRSASDFSRRNCRAFRASAPVRPSSSSQSTSSTGDLSGSP
mmetsp:Transcript_54454/g.100677  ORF Transcript_54454/g.100677 Transcript_54454/m.100677 type:complete len:247 (-) Transcript_54454:212-952(-)